MSPVLAKAGTLAAGTFSINLERPAQGYSRGQLAGELPVDFQLFAKEICNNKYIIVSEQTSKDQNQPAPRLHLISPLGKGFCST